MVLDPDESVVAAIGLVFQQFRLLGTAFKVMRFFAINQIPFPRRLWRLGETGTLHWGPATHSRITAILHNLTYTGTYVYGRRRSVALIESAELEHHWQLRLERARYESERAERQFDAVEPENRLVARTLEKRWNEKLQQLTSLEQDYLSARQVQRLQLSQQQRQLIL